jgi:YVTN family beta-propeller protein
MNRSKFTTLLVTAILMFVMAACSPASNADTAALEQQLADANAQIDELTAQLEAANTEHDMEHEEAEETEPTAAPAETTTEATEEPAAEEHMMKTHDVFYAFSNGKIIVIDPETGTAIHEITEGLEGVGFADPIASPDGKYVFVNDRTNAQVIVIEAASMSIIKKIDVGPAPVHIYNPNHGGEIWTHSDGEGAFYVIDIATLEVTAVVNGALTGAGHGKLAYGYENKGYATNVLDPGVHVIDLETKETTGFIETCKGEDGTGGTHAKTYSEVSGHIYIECTTVGYTAIIDPATDTVIGQIDAGKGQLFTLEDGKWVIIMDKQNGFVHVVDAATDTVTASIPVSGGADKIAFQQIDGTWFGFTANTHASDSAVINFSTLEVVNRVAAGQIYRDPDAFFYHRAVDAGGGWVALPASGDGFVAIINAASQTLSAIVPLPGAASVLWLGGGH